VGDYFAHAKEVVNDIEDAKVNREADSADDEEFAEALQFFGRDGAQERKISHGL
jgi:hypothetical protein